MVAEVVNGLDGRKAVIWWPKVGPDVVAESTSPDMVVEVIVGAGPETGRGE